MPGIAVSNGNQNYGLPLATINQLHSSAYGSGAPSSAGGPAIASSPYTNNGNTGGGIGADLSGQPGYGAIIQNQAYIPSVNPANYTIDPAGSATYRGQEGAVAGSFNNIYNGGQAFQNSQTAIGNQQNQNFQNSLNASTAQFLNNGQGLGNYDGGLASQGQAQQQGAYNDVANLAAGKGPSLAGKNLQAGLNSENQAIQAQAMTNQGLNGAGNTQRNLLNAQAANANNFAQAGGQASVAEQLGALGQESSAAANLRAANQAQASAASSAGLAQRSQNAGALSTLYGNQLAGNAQQNSNASNAANIGLGFQTQGATGASNAYGNQYQTYVNQQQQNAAYDAAAQNEGNTRANIGIAAQQSEAGQGSGVTQTVGNAVAAGGQAAAQASDENIKTDIMQGDAAGSHIDSLLDQINVGNYQPPSASAKTDTGAVPDFANANLTMKGAPKSALAGKAGSLAANAPKPKQDSGSSALDGLGALAAIAITGGAAAVPYIWDGVKWVANNAGQIAGDVGSGIEQGAKGVGNGLESAWNWATNW